MDAQKPDALPKSTLGIAIGYVPHNREALTSYTTSGHLSIINNVSDHRMNISMYLCEHWLFTGIENGGKTIAVLFIAVSSCQRNGHDPFAHLRDVLERIPDLPKECMAELLPNRWSPPKAADATTAEGPGDRNVPTG